MNILVVGNPFDGLRLVGPFEDGDDVADYAEIHEKNETWWIVACEQPERSWIYHARYPDPPEVGVHVFKGDSVLAACKLCGNPYKHFSHG